MDDFRIDSLGFGDSQGDQKRDKSQKRAKQIYVEPKQDQTDQVILSSDDEIEDQGLGYFPASSTDKPK
jgi:hypothetical protein